MSRSYSNRHEKDGLFIGVKNTSNKQAKRKANRDFRRKNKILINKEEEPYNNLRDVSDVWCFPTDGLPLYVKDSNKELTKYRRK